MPKDLRIRQKSLKNIIMNTKFKIFCICCGMALAGIVSTAKSYADNGKVKIGYCIPSSDVCVIAGDNIIAGTFVE